MAEITIKDIARQCGVSVSTVSRALNDNPEIKVETKSMILQVIKESGFVPNNSARNLKRVDANNIAVLVKGITNPFFSNMIKVMEEEIQKQRFSLVLHHVEEHEDEVDIALELIKEKRLKGVIFLGGYFIQAEEKLKQLSVPFVFSTVGARPNNMNKGLYSNIAVDDREESKRIVSYLLDIGHTDIAIIVSETANRTLGYQRLEGYKAAYAEHGLPVNEELITIVDKTLDFYSMENGYVTTQKLIKSGVKFTALFAIADSLAIGASRAIMDAGMSIPGDVSVAGYDGIDWVDFYYPRLTTLKQPVEEMALATITLLFSIIAGRSEHKHLTFKGELLVKESTAPLEH